MQRATTGAIVPYYGYSFWIADSYHTPVFSQQGLLGQYIITIPDHGLVIVRLGRKALPNGPDHSPEDLHIIVEEMLNIAG